MRITKCCICGKTIKDDIRDGNNPDPLKDEQGKYLAENPDNVCCHECDVTYVTPYRICQAYGQTEQCRLIQQKVLDLRKGWVGK